MKIYAIGDIEVDGGTKVRGVLLEGTIEEVRAVAGLYAKGGDEFEVCEVKAKDSEVKP